MATKVYFRNEAGKMCNKKDAAYVEINGAEISLAEYNNFLKLSLEEKAEALARYSAEGEGTRELRAYGDELMLSRYASESKKIKREDPSMVASFLKRKEEDLKDSIYRMSKSKDKYIQKTLERRKRDYQICKEIINKGVTGAVFSKYNRCLVLKTEDGLLVFETADDLCGEIDSKIYGPTLLHTLYATHFFLTAQRARKEDTHFAIKKDVIVAGNDALLLKQYSTGEFIGVRCYGDNRNVWEFAGAYHELSLGDWLSKNDAVIPSYAKIRFPIRRSVHAEETAPAVMDIEIRGEHYLLVFPVKNLSLNPLAFKTDILAEKCEWKEISPKVRYHMTTRPQTIIM